MHHTPTTLHPASSLDDTRRGMALFVTVALLGLLTALAFVVFTATRLDFQISRNLVITQRAFEQAESGLHFVKSEIERELVAGQTLDVIAASFHADPPSGYTFDPVTAMTQLADTNQYFFEVTGRSAEALATLQVAIRQADSMILGIFGDLNVDTMPNIMAYSYNGDLVADPQPTNSTGEATIGSNVNIAIQPNVLVDGLFVIGADEFGNVGTYPAGWGVEERERIDPDPLGARAGGALAKRFASIKATNNNDSSPYIVDDKIVLKKDGEVVLTTGNYYLTEVSIDGLSSIMIDATGGPVNLFLEGGFYMAPGGDLNTQGKPVDFRVFSNNSAPIQMKPKGHSKVFVYAPDADVQIYPNNNFYGAVWAKTADLKPGGDIWIDTSLLRRVKSNRVIVSSWKEVRR